MKKRKEQGNDDSMMTALINVVHHETSFKKNKITISVIRMSANSNYEIYKGTDVAIF